MSHSKAIRMPHSQCNRGPVFLLQYIKSVAADNRASLLSNTTTVTVLLGCVWLGRTVVS